MPATPPLGDQIAEIDDSIICLLEERMNLIRTQCRAGVLDDNALKGQTAAAEAAAAACELPKGLVSEVYDAIEKYAVAEAGRSGGNE